MGAFLLQSTGIASAVLVAFLILGFAVLFFIMLSIGGKFFKSTYCALGFYCIVRLGSQVCGIAYAKLGSNNQHPLLIPYLVLGLVGFMALLVVSLNYTVKGQKLAFGRSWIATSFITRERVHHPRLNLILITWMWGSTKKSLILLITAGMVLSIVGVSLMNFDDLAQSPSTAQPLRSAGLIIQFVTAVAVIALNLYVAIKERARNHFTLVVLSSSPFLFIRGLYGVLSSYVTNLDFLNLSNYTNAKSLRTLTIYQYVLENAMEYFAFLFLLSDYFFDRRLRLEESTSEKDMIEVESKCE